MNKKLSIIALLAVAAIFLQFGCDDGIHRQPVGWSYAGDISAGGSEDQPAGTADDGASDALLKCVDVTDYKNIEEETEEDLTEGDITSKSTAIESMQLLGSKATNSFQKCIKDEIKQMKKCGKSCIHFWSGGTILITREKFYRKPASSDVDIVEFMSCSQVEAADCLLTD